MTDFLDEIEIRCKKCDKEYKYKDLIDGYCKECRDSTDFMCQECGEPISENEHNTRQGYCFSCHKAWLKSGINISRAVVETYPGTGV